MLKLAANEYLKSIGDKHFIPSPDYLEWADINCLDIIIKRRPKWIWQNDKYFYDHMNINDLIDYPFSDISHYLSQPEPRTSTFTWSSKHDVNGKVGGGIASLVSLDLSANDCVTVSIDMSGVEKQSVDYRAILKDLKTKKINFNSNYIRHIANNKHNVICLVTQYLYLTQKTEMKVTVDINIGEKAKETGTSEISIKDDAKMDINKTKSIVFDVGTRMAIDFLELLIYPDGSFELLDRFQETSKRIMIPKLPEIMKELPNHCAHLTKDFDTPDNAKTDISPIASYNCSDDKCSQVLDNADILNVTRDLLAIAIDEKTVLKQLDAFVIACQGANTVDLSVFKENKNANLAKLLKCIGMNVEITSTEIIPTNKLNHDTIGRILTKIEAIHHLELPYLQNFLTIIEEGNSEHFGLLFTYLHNLKKDNPVDTTNREKLFQDGKYKLLLLSVGVTETSTQVNEYFEPIFILLHGS